MKPIDEWAREILDDVKVLKGDVLLFHEGYPTVLIYPAIAKGIAAALRELRTQAEKVARGEIGAPFQPGALGLDTIPIVMRNHIADEIAKLGEE